MMADSEEGVNYNEKEVKEGSEGVKPCVFKKAGRRANRKRKKQSSSEG